MEDEKVLEIEKSEAFLNAALALVQMAVGMMSGSVIMLSDALCSAHHAFGTAERKSGGERLAGLMLIGMFTLSCLVLIFLCARQLITGSYENGSRPDFFVIAVCAGSVIIKRMMSRHLLYLFLEHKSSSLLGDAWHEKMDGTLFLVSLLGLCAARLGLLWAEPVAGIGICLYFIRGLLVL